ncbi:MAG: hypothetical protein L3J05_05385 [Robiginitomaculum sp.]|nr:hypothetical protein [Robiginitomaculum sp.]
MLKFRGIMKYRLITVFLIFVFYPATAFANSLDWANGIWALDPQYASKEELVEYSCKTNPLTISIDKEKNVFKVRHPDSDANKAAIISSSANSLVIMYENEERVMDNGKLQVWGMYFLDKDHFTWVRQDWIKDGKITGRTTPRMRCPTNLIG